MSLTNFLSPATLIRVIALRSIIQLEQVPVTDKPLVVGAACAVRMHFGVCPGTVKELSSDGWVKAEYCFINRYGVTTCDSTWLPVEFVKAV